MTARKPLRVATPEDPPAKDPPAKAMNVAEAAEKGTHRDLLVAMRTRIARAVNDPDCPPRDLAALSRRLQDIAKEIESVDVQAEEEASERVATPDETWNSEAL